MTTGSRRGYTTTTSCWCPDWSAGGGHRNRSASSCTCRGRNRTSSPGRPGGHNWSAACSAPMCSPSRPERFRATSSAPAVRDVLAGEIVVRGPRIELASGRSVRTAASPISIDPAALARAARSAATDRVSAQLRSRFRGRTVLLGVDRLDYTKGIVERLLAYEELLIRRPELRHRLSFVQIAVPSRTDLQEYRQIRARVDAAVGRINERFADPDDDLAVYLVHRQLSREQLAAYYARGDLLLFVTSLADGMNLVAKEYVAVQAAVGGSGGLLLSQFAGAAAELQEAWLCNPYDIAGLSRAIERLLDIPPETSRARIESLDERIRCWDAASWAAAELAAIAAAAEPARQVRAG